MIDPLQQEFRDLELWVKEWRLAGKALRLERRIWPSDGCPEVFFLPGFHLGLSQAGRWKVWSSKKSGSFRDLEKALELADEILRDG